MCKFCYLKEAGIVGSLTILWSRSSFDGYIFVIPFEFIISARINSSFPLTNWKIKKDRFLRVPRLWIGRYISRKCLSFFQWDRKRGQESRFHMLALRLFRLFVRFKHYTNSNILLLFNLIRNVLKGRYLVILNYKKC